MVTADRYLAPDASWAPTTPCTLVVVSGTRGIGTSLTAALLALGGADLGPTLAIEASGRVALPRWRRGGAPRHGLGALVDGSVDPRDCVTPIAPSLDLVAAFGSDEAISANGISASARRTACRGARALGTGHRLVVIDAGTDIALAIDACADGSGRLVMITNGDAATIAATYAVAKVARNVGLLDAPWVIGARQGGAVGPVAHGILQQAASRFGGESPLLAGGIPDDPCLGVALGAGMCLDDAATGSPALIAATHAVRRIVSAAGSQLPPRTPVAATAADTMSGLGPLFTNVATSGPAMRAPATLGL